MPYCAVTLNPGQGPGRSWSCQVLTAPHANKWGRVATLVCVGAKPPQALLSDPEGQADEYRTHHSPFHNVPLFFCYFFLAWLPLNHLSSRTPLSQYPMHYNNKPISQHPPLPPHRPYTIPHYRIFYQISIQVLPIRFPDNNTYYKSNIYYYNNNTLSQPPYSIITSQPPTPPITTFPLYPPSAILIFINPILSSLIRYHLIRPRQSR